jgi:hypothetical protein
LKFAPGWQVQGQLLIRFLFFVVTVQVTGTLAFKRRSPDR